MNRQKVSTIAALSAFGVASWFGGQKFERNRIFKENIDVGDDILHVGNGPVKPKKIFVPPPEVENPKRIQEILKFGSPKAEVERRFSDYVVSFDTRNRIPYWTCEHLTGDRVKRTGPVTREESEFYEDDQVNLRLRSTNFDYFRSGYDRGHLAAAGNHMKTQTDCDQTFILSNIAPQVGVGFNRHAWNYLEKYVRRLARDSKNVYVYTGPIFQPIKNPRTNKAYMNYEVIGNNQVSVPTHFFKVVLIEKSEGPFLLECYVLENKNLGEVKEFSPFRVSIYDVEKMSGLSFKSIIDKSAIINDTRFSWTE